MVVGFVGGVDCDGRVDDVLSGGHGHSLGHFDGFDDLNPYNFSLVAVENTPSWMLAR